MRSLARYLEDLLGHRRPRRFRATPEDDAVLRTAIALRAGRPGSGEPQEAFVSDLHARLAAELEPAPPARPGRTSRRQFVQVASVAATAAALGAGIDHIVESNQSDAPTRADQTLTPNAGQWRTVTPSTDLVEGGVAPFDLGTVVGFVVRTNGRVRAVSGICTHQSCRLAFEAATRRLNCPCHNAAFALTGEVVTHQLKIAPAALPHLAVREVDGAVQVYAPKSGS